MLKTIKDLIEDLQKFPADTGIGILVGAGYSMIDKTERISAGNFVFLIPAGDELHWAKKRRRARERQATTLI